MGLPTPYQEYIHLSRYSRFDYEKNRRETWEETVDRYFNFFKEHLFDVCEFKPTPQIITTLKNAILNYLRGINIRTEKEIIENVRDFSKSATPERSINRTLNELFKKKTLQNYILKMILFLHGIHYALKIGKKDFLDFTNLFQKLIEKVYRLQCILALIKLETKI